MPAALHLLLLLLWCPPGTGIGIGSGIGSRRARRFVSAPRYVETLLVADASMARFYGEELESHVLTLLAVAADIYRHPSLSNAVNLVAVKVLVLEDEEAGPAVSDNGGLTLRNFCAWQRRFNPPSDRHPEHYDTAVLLTRKDFCGHQSCDTLGVADMGTMCDRNKSCSVIEDEGLQAAYTLAHELGHVLSMPHDDAQTCERLSGPPGPHHVMAPLFTRLNRSQPWSPCSAAHLTDFLDGGHGDCLLDAPARALPLPAGPPGRWARYSLDAQCRHAFGHGFAHCANATAGGACAQLWCHHRNGTGTTQALCHTKNGSLPWADGSPCEGGGLCWDGRCVPPGALQPQPPVDGGWGAWGAWGPCSRTCGGGIHFSQRPCDSPRPRHGGRYCEGQRARYRSCRTEECPPGGQSFREQQCAKYDGYNLTDARGAPLAWVPKYAGVAPRDRCKLSCRARGRSEFRVFEPKVVDGTPCAPETLAVCVRGRCVKAGCDHVVGSPRRLDQCGVCGGDGSTCRRISGSLSRSSYGYTDVVTIPAGATNIEVKQRRRGGRYLALRTPGGRYLLNGGFSVSPAERHIPLAGTVLRYSGSTGALERLRSSRRLPEPLTVQLLSVAGEPRPPKVKYSFFLPKDVPFGDGKGRREEAPGAVCAGEQSGSCGGEQIPWEPRD